MNKGVKNNQDIKITKPEFDVVDGNKKYSKTIYVTQDLKVHSTAEAANAHEIKARDEAMIEENKNMLYKPYRRLKK